jgi:DNA processing protein
VSAEGGAIAACDDCLRRTDLIGAIAGRLDIEWRRRPGPQRVLALSDEDLVAVGASAEVARRYARFRPDAARRRVSAAGLGAVCRCRKGYPSMLEDLTDPPAVLHLAGHASAVADLDAVAIVGARAATPYGLEVARGLGRALSVAGVAVVSGLALGVDSAAQAGAVEGAAPVVAVLAAGAERPYPATKERLYAAIRADGCVVSELPPGSAIHRWAFVARNRIIAALARVVVVVEATQRSGSLTTADFATDLGRTVAAVPGRVTSRLAVGTNALIKDGAALVRGPLDVLDLLADLTGQTFAVRAEAPPVPVEPRLRGLLSAIERGRGTVAELAVSSDDARAVLAGLGELETLGLVRRGFGGRYERAAS